MSQAHLYQELPAPAAEALRKLFALQETPPPALPQYKNLKVKFTPGLSQEQRALLTEAFTAVSFPEGSIPLPTTLTTSQRALALLLAEHPARLNDWPVPAEPWARKRWLGLAPQGALEQEVAFVHQGQERKAPLWMALTLLNQDKEKAQRAALWNALPLATRMEVYGDASLGAYQLSLSGLDVPLDWSMGEEGKEWAPAFADRILPYIEDGSIDEFSFAIKQITCLSLLRARVPLEARWEPLIPVQIRPNEALALTVELLSSLPLARRSAVIIAALHQKFPRYAVQAALALLPKFPLVEVAQYILDNCDDIDSYPKRKILDELQAIAKQHEDLTALVDPFIAALPPLKRLVWKSLLSPQSATELSEIQLAQCATGSGNIMGAGSDWVNEEEIEYLTVGTLADEEGNALYDTTIFMDEDGTIFRHGTTEPVAWLCQYRLDCQDPELKESLQLALQERGNSRG